MGIVFCCVHPYRHYQMMIKMFVLFSMVLLIGVLFFVEEANNATRSITLFRSISIPPSEFIKLGLILYLAYVYSKKQEYITQFSTAVLPPLVLTGFILGLILLQPDIGTAAIIFLFACAIIFSSGIHFKHLFILIAIKITLFVITIPSMITDVRVARFTGAYEPFATPETGGYHLIQSYLAIGVGGLTGEGLGQSVQKLGYLWGAHTDFIMSVITEELGLVGLIIVVGMLMIIVLRGFYIARECEDSFGSLIAIGISSMIGIQAIINMGAISGVLPVTGIPLPFLSYGGCFLFVLMLFIVILNNISMFVYNNKKKTQKKGQTQQTQNSEFNNVGGRSWSS